MAVGMAALIAASVGASDARAEVGCDTRGVCTVVDEFDPPPSGDGKPSGKTVKAPPPACSSLPAPLDVSAVPPGSVDFVPVKCVMPDGQLIAHLFPRVIARQMAWYLIDRIHLKPIRIGGTPLSSAPDSMGLVGLPVWLWVDRPSPDTWGPNRASAGGVSLVARVESITWSMGDGTTFSCGLGTPWKPALGAGESPTCGHVYVKQGTYTITATTHWVARWSGYGESGTIRLPLTARRTYRVGELQVIVTRR